jgi:hypothetical protein
MRKRIKKMSHDLNNGEVFCFKDGETQFKVVGYIHYQTVGKKRSKCRLIPQGKEVITFKTF